MSKQLLQKNTRFLLRWLPLVLVCCSLLFYVFLRMQTHHMQEKQLQLKQQNVWKEFTVSDAGIARHIKGEYDIVQGNERWLLELDEPRDTSLYYESKGKDIPFEILTGRFNWKGNEYYVTTYVSSTEISHLMIKVFITEIIILVVLLIAIVVLNRKSSGSLWQPFFTTLGAMDKFDITRQQSIELETNTGITEFDRLNKEISNLIANTGSAYSNQKQFVENASHEMQTPLAIIRSKLELLINNPGLNAGIADMLQDITEANDRLSQMNRTLLLLAKIENNQFPEIEQINLTAMLRQTMENLQTYHDDFPSVEMELSDNMMLQANRSLIEMLISNLINNAVIHNNEESKMKIRLQKHQLMITNTGLPLQGNAEQLFERFHKDSHISKSTGLGLALVKQVCLLYGYHIGYVYKDGWHTVTVDFS
jgi:signal transduction histidine kinase